MRQDHAQDLGLSLDRQRLDKWLWHARIVRTRSDAAALVAGGRVRVNGERTRTPGRSVRSGDVLTVALDRAVRVLRVADFAMRRGSAADARLLFVDLSSGAQEMDANRSGPAADSAA